MGLSKIELIGFKSFMSPITLNFREGITAILGPNGCGKTNIVDAVRWALGEQSPRQLRGSKMENVIFNGTQKHKPLGCAVVNLTLDNERGQFPLDYSEITITRKVYRSGVSEYFINKAPCRLKDIRDLFADTGTGSHSYSVIEQEMIDWVLNDIQGERRLMFEEAAGIVKYRMRREEARRKLELTDADLVRLDDIVEELRKNVRSLKYQMAKAKRYEIVRDRIRSWELVHLRRLLGELLAERRAAERELAGLGDLAKAEDSSLAELEKRLSEARTAHMELERSRSEIQNERYEARKKIDACEGSIIQLTERQKQARMRIEKAKREIEESQKRLIDVSARQSDVVGRIGRLEAKIEEDESAVLAVSDEARELARRIAELDAKLVEAKQTQLDFLQDRARAESEREHLERKLSELDSRLVEIRDRIADLEREEARLGKEKEEAISQCRTLEERLSSLERERIELLEKRQSFEQFLIEGEQKLGARRAELGAARSKLDLLQRMKENFEGFPAGARYILGKGDPRVLGPLAEVLHMEERLKAAVEAVLSGMLDAIVVGDFEDALDIAREIESSKAGRARLFSKRGFGGGTRRERAIPAGSLGALSSFVSCDGEYRDLLERILGEVYLFEDPNAAIEYAAACESLEGGAVTVSGLFFSPVRGVYIAEGASEQFSLLGRNEELAKTRQVISDLEAEISGIATSCDAQRAERERVTCRLREIEAEVISLRGEHSKRSEELRAMERAHAGCKEKADLLMKSSEEIEIEREGALARLEEAKLSLELGAVEPAQESASLENELLELRNRKEELDATITEKRIALASLRGELEKNREEQRGLAEMEREFRSLTEERKGEISSSTVELGELETSIIAEREGMRKLLEEETRCEQKIASLSAELEERAREVEEAEKELKRRSSERERLFEKLNEVKVTVSSIETRMRDMVEKAREMYGRDLSCYLEGMELPLSDEEASITKEMIERERKKLESLGAVNLAAVEEYSEQKKRLDFLETQRADLVKAKEELVEAIEKINARARELFLETFSAVRKNFQETFEILFEGGEADLSLSDGADPLEADIVITARPQGKRLQDISLLSGGERALTALALLFALYKTKPSPFCIFDEVDAPLDDANVQRFVRMLNVFKKDTQFIIITHNKRTMEAAEQLYGVTMEERGVSRVVSVDFENIEKVLKNRATSERVLVSSELSSSN